MSDRVWALAMTRNSRPAWMAKACSTPGKPVVRLVDVGSLEVSVQTPIDAARYIAENAKLTVEIEGKPAQATVRAIVPVGDIASRTIESGSRSWGGVVGTPETGVPILKIRSDTRTVLRMTLLAVLIA